MTINEARGLETFALEGGNGLCWYSQVSNSFSLVFIPFLGRL